MRRQMIYQRSDVASHQPQIPQRVTFSSVVLFRPKAAQPLFSTFDTIAKSTGPTTLRVSTRTLHRKSLPI